MDCYKQKIALTNVRFYAYHGYYPEEQLLGNEFFLNLTCTLQHIAGKDDHLANTVNYEALYKIMAEEMATPRKLLETVVKNILTTVKDNFAEISTIEVTLRKSNPPFGGDIATAEVSLSWEQT